MTVVLGIVAGVAVVALVWSILALRSSSKRLAETGSELAEAEGRLGESRLAEEAVRRDLEQERRRGGDAATRAQEADERATRAESRASNAEAALEALIAARSPAVIAEIERVRLEREWREISGLDAPLPVRWDASPAAALEIELEIIREVTGTPSRLEIAAVSPDGSARNGETFAAGGDDRAGGRAEDSRPWMIGSLGCELTRLVARYADEMVVRLDLCSEPGPSLYVAAFGGGPVPDLSSVEMAAKALGMSLALGQAGDGFGVRLSAD